MQKQLVNLTPHRIDICDENGTRIGSIEPSGQVARVSVNGFNVGFVETQFGDIPCSKTLFGGLTGLGNLDPVNCIYIVSSLVLEEITIDHPLACCIVAPGELLRGFDGNVIGCKGLRIPSFGGILCKL